MGTKITPSSFRRRKPANAVHFEKPLTDREFKKIENKVDQQTLLDDVRRINARRMKRLPASLKKQIEAFEAENAPDDLHPLLAAYVDYRLDIRDVEDKQEVTLPAMEAHARSIARACGDEKLAHTIAEFYCASVDEAFRALLGRSLS